MFIFMKKEINNNQFRTLNADEIDVRVQSVSGSQRGVLAVLLLYKDARVDMNLLDEAYGCHGWQREHTIKDGRNYCKVSVKNPDTGEWIAKEDVGTESNTEATKGEASDAFKRACVNLGIGRELYTSPKMVVKLDEREVTKGAGSRGDTYRLAGWVKFRVSQVAYDDRRTISRLVIVDQDGKTRYTFGAVAADERPVSAPAAQAVASAPAPAAKPRKKRITARTIDTPAQCAGMLEMLAQGYRNAPDNFSPLDFLAVQGFEIEDGVVEVILDKWTNYFIINNLDGNDTL